jgi:hypothetical protein
LFLDAIIAAEIGTYFKFFLTALMVLLQFFSVFHFNYVMIRDFPASPEDYEQ